MPTFRAEQLIRDKRLQWLKEQGVTVDYTTLEEDDLIHALRTKLMEEATEAALEDVPENLLKELADVLEVAFALAEKIGFDKQDLLNKQQERHVELGGFEDGIMSKTVSMKLDNPAVAYYREQPEKYPELEQDA